MGRPFEYVLIGITQLMLSVSLYHQVIKLTILHCIYFTIQDLF